MPPSDGEHECLGEQVHDQLPSRGTERSPQGNLRLAQHAAGEQEAGNVRAGHQEQHQHGAQQHEQHPSQVAYEPLVQRQQPQLPRLVLRVGGFELTRDDVHLRLRLAERDPGREPADQAQEVKPPDLRLRIVQ
jgi:hypothetical protein